MSELAWRGTVIDLPRVFTTEGAAPLLAFTLRCAEPSGPVIYRVVARGSGAADALEVIKVNPGLVMIAGELLADGRINAHAIGLRIDFDA